jgi:photosystem II stability/assembly factor-like uncharacterized protein
MHVGGLLDVSMVSRDEGWAVGGGGSIFHYSGGAWMIAPSPTTAQLRSIAMISATDGWAVGENGTILHYTGGVWSTVASPTDSFLYSVAMVSAMMAGPLAKLASLASSCAIRMARGPRCRARQTRS